MPRPNLNDFIDIAKLGEHGRRTRKGYAVTPSGEIRCVLIGTNDPLLSHTKINPVYGELDPYFMAASAIDESLRQIIAVGGSLKEVVYLINGND